ncbi:MAG: hypothetical protein EOO22_04335 [Comamonadaceae bacterium]|nr:MAG: hypothetical protein EOO22_04335 [Comamonadaceae bacterium]
MTTEIVDQTLLELRVLYGPQAGSHMALAPGEYLLGHSDQCAVVLAGSRMAARHALLVVEDDGFRLRPQEGAVSDGKGHEVTDEIVLAPGMAVEFGGVSITLDHPDAPWPDERAPLALMPPAAAPAGSAEAQADAAAEAGTPTQTGTEGSAVPAAPVPVLAAAGASGPPWRRKLDEWLAAARGNPHVQRALAWRPAPDWRPNVLWLTSAGAGIALVLAAVLAALLLGLHEPQYADPSALAKGSTSGFESSPPIGAAPGSAAPPDALIKVLQAQDPRLTLVLRPEVDGRWSVGGYVPTEADRSRVVQALSAVSPAPTLRLHAEDAIVRKAAEALEASADGANDMLKVQNLGQGKLKLTGAARHATGLQTARLALLTVPGVTEVETSALLPEQLLATLKQRIEQAGLAQRLSFAREWPEVVVEGSLDSAETLRWNELLANFKAAYGGVLPVRTATSTAVVPTAVVATGTPTPGRPPLDVRIIVGGASPYVVTSQGVRMHRGSELNGQRLIGVNDAEAVFDGGQRWQVGR